MKKSFTLIEILVVVTIIVLLTSTAIVTYSTFLKQSRDAKRKADLEQIRAALEMYRSSNDTYPADLPTLTSATEKYIESVPQDPKNPTNTYYYNYVSASDYSLDAFLEGGGASCLAAQCGGYCNYCLGPYGEK